MKTYKEMLLERESLMIGVDDTLKPENNHRIIPKMEQRVFELLKDKEDSESIIYNLMKNSD